MYVTSVGTMNEAGIDCDAGSGPDYIPRWNATMPSQFPASVGWIQGDAEDATFKRPESDGLANGVGDEGVPIASCGERCRRLGPKGLLALQCDRDVSLLALHKFFA
jgi:hypothetical protein